MSEKAHLGNSTPPFSHLKVDRLPSTSPPFSSAKKGDLRCIRERSVGRQEEVNPRRARPSCSPDGKSPATLSGEKNQ